MAINKCLPISKYSHAIGQNGSSIPWIHVQAADIFVVMEGDPNGSLTLQIVHGTSVLERVDIASYIDQAVYARTTAAKAGFQAQVDQLPIFGISKRNLLALRYKLDDGQPRRIQLRLQSVADCQVVIDLLERRGMEFQEQPQGAVRPSTATSRPGTGYSGLRPATTQANSPYNTTPKLSKPNPFSLPRIEPGSLSQLPTLSTDGSPACSEEHRTHSSRYDLPPRQVFARDEALAPREPERPRPSTRDFYRHHTTPALAASQDFVQSQPTREAFASERPSSTSHIAVAEAVCRAVEDREGTSCAGTEMRPPSAPRVNSHWFSISTESRISGDLSSDVVEARPQTTVSVTSVTTPTSDIPSGSCNPPGNRYGTRNDSSRPGSSSLALPPLKKPKIVEDRTASPSIQDLSAPSRRSSPSLPESTVRRQTPSLAQTTSNRDEANFAREVPVKALTDPHPMNKPLLPKATHSNDGSDKPIPMNELLYGKRKVLAERPGNVGMPHLSSSVDDPHKVVSSPAVAKPVRPWIVMSGPAPGHGTENNFIDRAINAIQSSTRSVDEESLEQFTSQTPEDRQAILEQFMIENLNNPSFTTLCEDVEGCWRRISLGL